MDLGVKGKIALVTGGCSGIGFAVSKSLATEGAVVCVTSRSEQKMQDAVSALNEISENHHLGIVSDISIPGQALSVFNKVLRKHARLDILVNNVGDTLGILDPYCPLEDWHKLFNLIMGVAIELNNLAIPVMSAEGWGRIVNITAGASMENSGPVPYCSFKAAFTAYSRSMARVLALEGNNVVMTAVLPGVVITEDGHWSKVLIDRPEHAEKYLEERTVLKRFGVPEEVSPIVTLLASELASFCVGSVIPVEGGQAKHYFQKVDDY
jgi:NAD(P)-dependent dehydrogenase (short-subunit alcohol dehydrogenase family)